MLEWTVVARRFTCDSIKSIFHSQGIDNSKAVHKIRIDKEMLRYCHLACSSVNRNTKLRVIVWIEKKMISIIQNKDERRTNKTSELWKKYSFTNEGADNFTSISWSLNWYGLIFVMLWLILVICFNFFAYRGTFVTLVLWIV